MRTQSCWFDSCQIHPSATEASCSGVYSAFALNFLGHEISVWRQILLICLASAGLGKVMGTLLCCWDWWEYGPERLKRCTGKNFSLFVVAKRLQKIQSGRKFLTNKRNVFFFNHRMSNWTMNGALHDAIEQKINKWIRKEARQVNLKDKFIQVFRYFFFCYRIRRESQAKIQLSCLC